MNSTGNLKRPVSLATLSRREWVSLTWSFWWKGLLICLIGIAASYVVGIIVGFFGSMLVRSFITTSEGWFIYRNIVMGTSFLLSFSIGLLLIPVYIRWLLSAPVGRFRLVLLRR